MKASHVAKVSLLSLVVLAVLPFLGCGNMLERQPPSEAAYIDDYLKYFDATQIAKLDYTYKGSIGGAMTVGRAKFKGPIRLDSEMLNAKIKAGTIKKGTYDPSKMNESDKMWLQHRWKTHAHGSIPSWFDFPYSRKLQTLTEEYEGRGGDDPRPRFEKVWYIDDENHVVYIRGNWG